MRSYVSYSLAIVCVVLVVSGPLQGATIEDLAACRLPNGVIALPERDSPGAAQGYILNFSEGKLAQGPYQKEGSRPDSVGEFFGRLRREWTGDLIYSSLNNGTFVALTARVSDLGRHYLYELDGRELEEPSEVLGEEERSAKGERTPGAIEGVQEGHCYILKTVQGNLALLRLVAKLERRALIQWVHQPDGTTVFQIPKGEVSIFELQAPSAVTETPRELAGPTKLHIESVEELTSKHLRARTVLLTKLTTLVAEKAESRSEIIAKAKAMECLGKIRASEAIPGLLTQIGFNNPYAQLREFRWDAAYPALGALRAIGKPASLGALQAIGRTELLLVADQATDMRIRLLTMVIHGVEGPEVAEFMLNRGIKRAKPQNKPALEKALQVLAELGS